MLIVSDPWAPIHRNTGLPPTIKLLVDDDFLEELGYLFGTKTTDETLDLVNSFDFNPPQSFGVVSKKTATKRARKRRGFS